MKVAKLFSANFKKTLTFNRIKNVYYEADFQKDFILSTEESVGAPDFVIDIVDEMNDLKSELSDAKNAININTNKIDNNRYEMGRHKLDFSFSK